MNKKISIKSGTYRKYGQSINPLHVEDMITKTFEAGYEQGKEDSQKSMEMGELPTPPLYWQ